MSKILVFLFLLAGCETLFAEPHKPISRYPPTGCVAYFPFDNGWGDLSLNRNYAIPVGAIANSNGVVNSALYCDGASYVELQNESLFDFDTNSAYTLSFWLKTTPGYNIAARAIIQKGWPYITGWTVWIWNNALNFMHCRDWGAGQHYEAYCPINRVNNGSWHHVVCTHSGEGNANGMAIYVDTIKVSSINNLNIASILNDKKPHIARYQNSSGNWLTTQLWMDELMVFTRVLSTQEIAYIYHSYKPRSP